MLEIKKRKKSIKTIFFILILIFDVFLVDYGIGKAIDATNDALKCIYCMFSAFVVYSFVLDTKKLIKIRKGE